MAEISAVIIARGGSQRLPHKNMLDFHGKPLLTHKIHQLQLSAGVNRIYVGSDDDNMLDVAQREGAIPLKRAPEFCDEKSRSWNDVIHDMATRVRGDAVLWAHCTNPCIMPATFTRAICEFMESPRSSLVGVTRIHSHFWFHEAPLNFQPFAGPHVVAAGLSPLYHQNGGIFINDRQRMIADRYVYGRDPQLFVMDCDEATDIDTEQDYERAKRLWPWVSNRWKRADG